MELILYYIKESKNLIASFLILMFILGNFAYLAMKNFRQDKKFKVFFYGLFLRMKSTDVLRLSVMVIRVFLTFYATIVTEKIQVYICLIMLAISSLIYMFCSIRKAIYIFCSTEVQLILIYLIYLVNNYIADIESTPILQLVKLSLTVIVLARSVYILCKDIDMLSEERVNKNLEKHRQTKKAVKGSN